MCQEGLSSPACAIHRIDRGLLASVLYFSRNELGSGHTWTRSEADLPGRKTNHPAMKIGPVAVFLQHHHVHTTVEYQLLEPLGTTSPSGHIASQNSIASSCFPNQNIVKFVWRAGFGVARKRRIVILLKTERIKEPFYPRRSGRCV